MACPFSFVHFIGFFVQVIPNLCGWTTKGRYSDIANIIRGLSALGRENCSNIHFSSQRPSVSMITSSANGRTLPTLYFCNKISRSLPNLPWGGFSFKP